MIMIMSANNRSYKVISLLIKALFLIFSFHYIFQKINQANNTINFYSLIDYSNKIYLPAVCLLMFVNWGLEALKWQLLITPLEPISYSISIRSILAGVTVSIFTPSRVGEFVGRIFFLEKADKIQATLKSFIGSFMQLFITIIAGVIAYFVLEIYYEIFFQTKQFTSSNSAALLIFCFIILTGSVIFIYTTRNTLFINYKKYIDAFTNYSISELLVVFGLSLARYFIFSLQYYLILNFFGVHAGNVILFSLIALTFFVTSVIPTFLITEIAVRGATAVYFFSTISVNSSAIVASSVLLWIINLAVPALIGSVFILNLKLVKD